MDAPAEDAIDIPLVNDLRELARVAARIDEFCSERNLPPDVAYACNLAIDELLSNAISHGYDDDEPHRVMVIVRLEADALVVVIVDAGAEFDPTRTPEPEAGLSLDGPEADGLGLLLVNRMMDAVAYQRRDGCNVVTLTKSVRSNGNA